MKFLCENCKAKYQIADDKVAGRTVRMKCRKCGHMIQVEASVTESSVANRAPQEDGANPAISSGSAVTGAVQAAALGLAPRLPGMAPPRPPPPARSAQGPLSPGAPAGGVASGVPRPVPRPQAGLAGAFSKAVIEPKDTPPSVSAAMAVLSSSASSEEWYIGINGVPVGPVRLSELRRKAASGVITEDSLVWREGFEEWVPLRTFPELCALLREASTAHPSLTPPTATMIGMHISNRPSSPGAPGGRSASVLPRAPGAAPGGRNNVVAIGSRRATAEKIADFGETVPEDEIRFESDPPAAQSAWASSDSFDPAGAAAISTQLGAHAHPLGAGAAEAHLGVPAAPGHLGGAAVSADPVAGPESLRRSSISARAAQARQAHPALWIVVALGGMLGGVGLMVALFPKPKPQPVQIVSVVMAPPPAPPASTATETEGTTIGPIELAAAPSKPAKGSKPSAVDTSAGAASTLSPSLTGLSGLVAGPAGPSGGSAPKSGGGQLAQADIERVVQGQRAFVKRQCWDNALSSRGSGTPSSARVEVRVNVARDGSVQSAEATGGDAYPGLASCVQARVKGWKFPPSEGQEFKVPFVFAAQ